MSEQIDFDNFAGDFICSGNFDGTCSVEGCISGPKYSIVRSVKYCPRCKPDQVLPQGVEFHGLFDKDDDIDDIGTETDEDVIDRVVNCLIDATPIDGIVYTRHVCEAAFEHATVALAVHTKELVEDDAFQEYIDKYALRMFDIVWCGLTNEQRIMAIERVTSEDAQQ